MPTSTAATTMRASSPGVSPPSLTGMRSVRVRPHAASADSRFDRQRARLAVDREPLHADGAAGHALGLRYRAAGARWPPHRRRCPSRCRPARAMRAVPGWHVLRHRVDEPVADHVERDLPAVRAVTATVMLSPARVFRLVERDLEQVRRVGAGLRIPAGVERHRGHRAVAVAGRHFEPIAAPLHRQPRCAPACRRRRRAGRRRRAAWIFTGSKSQTPSRRYH